MCNHRHFLFGWNFYLLVNSLFSGYYYLTFDYLTMNTQCRNSFLFLKKLLVEIRQRNLHLVIHGSAWHMSRDSGRVLRVDGSIFFLAKDFVLHPKGKVGE